MAIEVGEQVPRFELKLSGREYRPEPGARGQLLYFMRAADCAVCRAHVKRLIALQPQLEAKGLSTLVIVPEGESETQVSGSLHTPFPVVQGIAAHSAFGLHASCSRWCSSQARWSTTSRARCGTRATRRCRPTPSMKTPCSN